MLPVSGLKQTKAERQGDSGACRRDVEVVILPVGVHARARRTSMGPRTVLQGMASRVCTLSVGVGPGSTGAVRLGVVSNPVMTMFGRLEALRLVDVRQGLGGRGTGREAGRPGNPGQGQN